MEVSQVKLVSTEERTRICVSAQVRKNISKARIQRKNCNTLLVSFSCFFGRNRVHSVGFWFWSKVARERCNNTTGFTYITWCNGITWLHVLCTHFYPSSSLLLLPLDEEKKTISAEKSNRKCTQPGRKKYIMRLLRYVCVCVHVFFSLLCVLFWTSYYVCKTERSVVVVFFFFLVTTLLLLLLLLVQPTTFSSQKIYMFFDRPIITHTIL